MFHHDKSGKAKFGPSAPPARKPMPDKKPHGEPQAPHNATSSEKHVTESHPGKTQPHSKTGVHAFSAHHHGGGKYESHTHHDGGEVETRQHMNAGDMHQAASEALPDENQGMNENEQMASDQDNGDMGEAIGSGIGGSESA